MARTPDQDRAEAAERDKVQQPAPDARGTFYCQTGDHIVDSAVWLESITLGCRPCMEKLGLAIATEDWLPRLWSVGPEGTRLAKPIERPKPKKQWYESPDLARATPERSRNPFATSDYRGKPVKRVTERQEWECARCHSLDDRMDGFYNTVEGYVCKKCNGVAIKGEDRPDLKKRLTLLEMKRREERLNQKKMLENHADLIRKARRSLSPYAEAEHEMLRRMERSMQLDSLRSKADHSQHGTGASVRLAEVKPGQRVTVSGTGSRMIIDGDVGEGAILSASGTGTNIMIGGHVGQDATVMANGTGARVTYKTRAQQSQVQAHGTGANVSGKVIADAEVSAEQQVARADLARKYGLPYPDNSDSWEQFDLWMGAKEKMAPAVEKLQGKLYVCTCVRCGKRDVENPVLGGGEALDRGYKCLDCIQVVSKLDSRVPQHRRELLLGISKVNDLHVVRDLGQLNDVSKKSNMVAYLLPADQLFRYSEGTWTQVPMPAKKVTPEVKTPDHTHIWFEAWGEEGMFCNQCGARG